MTTPALPTDGMTDWGDALNAYITNVVVSTLNTWVTNLSSHEANSPSDPHGDRAFALNLMLPITQNVNQPGGFVQLTTAGLVPASVLPTPDTWHDLRPYATSFAVATGLLPPQYRQVNGGVQLAGYVATTANGYDAFVLANYLPDAIIPNAAVDLPVTVSAAGTGASDGTPIMTIGTDGTVLLSQMPTGLATGTVIGIAGWYPLSALYSLITS